MILSVNSREGLNRTAKNFIVNRCDRPGSSYRMHSLCPYCGVRQTNSDDHVFPEFLGGRATIRAWKPCNDVFGHSIGGAVSIDLLHWSSPYEEPVCIPQGSWSGRERLSMLMASNMT